MYSSLGALATCQDTQNKNNENNRNDHILRTARFINYIDQQSNLVDCSIYESNLFRNLNLFMGEKNDR